MTITFSPFNHLNLSNGSSVYISFSSYFFSYSPSTYYDVGYLRVCFYSFV